MEQEIDIKQQLTILIAEPEKVGSDHKSMLMDLVSLYPYFQPLHLLLAKATLEDAEGNSALATAALYTNGQLLHNFLYEPEFLLSTDFKVIYAPAYDQLSNEPEALDEAVLDEVPAETEETSNSDEQETFDEIAELNVETFQTEAPVNVDKENEKVEDDLVLENIVATDFFAFQDNFDIDPVEVKTAAAEMEVPDIEEYHEDEPEQEEPVVISKYDDDKLPYTFLWWLAKTRKEHQQIFQPYVSPKNNHARIPGRPNELQQQYVENIFHLQSPFAEEAEEYYPTDHLKPHTKGTEIIDSFLKNDPQISPPNAEQINNENKAKKSAEDHNDLVSETLAKIYIEQMLYDKAIETYEKLSLKFPEKSRYFADLIQSIEKKI